MNSRIEYRIHWTYPYLENQGKSDYGPPAPTVKDAIGITARYDDGFEWAGKVLGVQSRVVTETDWVDEPYEI